MDSKLEKLNSLSGRMERILDSQFSLAAEIKIANDELYFIQKAILEEESLKKESFKITEEIEELGIKEEHSSTIDAGEDTISENVFAEEEENITLEKFTGTSEIDESSLKDIHLEETQEKSEEEEILSVEQEQVDQQQNYQEQEAKQQFSRKDYYTYQKKPSAPKSKKNIEKFIGENLISKLGVLILILGIAFGTKYSIDNNLLSPLARIISGYISGLVLGAFSFILRKKYENLSAVLISGATAVSYFVTFSAYRFYELIPQELAFGMMTIFTVFTVIAALSYNKQVIAHIGMIAAYAVPFLLSDGSGRVGIMLSYVSIINIGLLVISFKKYWKSITYVSVILSWFIFLTSFASTSAGFELRFGFATVFFSTFYISMLAYKAIRNEEHHPGFTGLLTFNNIIYYIVAATLISREYDSDLVNGLFALANGIIHFSVAALLHKRKVQDRVVIHLLAGFVLFFVAISIPLAFDGNVIPVLWIAEAALLFGLARKHALPKYELISFVLLLFSILGLTIERLDLYDYWSSVSITPVFNEYMLTGTLFTAILGVMVYLAHKHTRKEYSSIIPINAANTVLVLLFLTSLYLLFSLEIMHYFNNVIQEVKELKIDLRDNLEIAKAHGHIWQIVYAALFLSTLNIVNHKKYKSDVISQVANSLSVLVVAIFLMFGLWDISVLRELYLKMNGIDSIGYGIFNIFTRYISIAVIAIHTVIMFKSFANDKGFDTKQIGLELYVALASVWVLTSEIIHHLDMAGITETYKFGISIGWSVSAILLIVLGIVQSKRHFRVFGLLLFSVTIVKLFFYDISNLHIISKTIIMVVLGVLMLITSYLYSRFKNKLFGNEGDEEKNNTDS